MKNALTRASIGCTVIIGCALLLVLATRGYEALVPAQVEHNSANITQSDFTQARAKWDTQKISVYEINVDTGNLQCRMRVDRKTGNLYLLTLRVDGTDESVDGLRTALSGVQIKAFGAYSVDSVFDSINQAVAGLSTGATSAQAMNSTDAATFTDVDVQFDANTGYPMRFTEYTRSTPASHEITWRTKDSELQITDLTVIN